MSRDTVNHLTSDSERGSIAEVRDLVVRFGDFTAVDGLSFDV